MNTDYHISTIGNRINEKAYFISGKKYMQNILDMLLIEPESLGNKWAWLDLLSEIEINMNDPNFKIPFYIDDSVNNCMENDYIIIHDGLPHINPNRISTTYTQELLDLYNMNLRIDRWLLYNEGS